MSTVSKPTSLDMQTARRLVDRRFERSATVTERFFAAEADRVSRACLALARRFDRGGRLLVFGTGAEASDAHHVSVEFVHPVLVGKRALPAIALSADAAAVSGAARTIPGEPPDPEAVFERLIEVLGREADVALGISRGAPGAAVRRGLDAARRAGLLTIGVEGSGREAAPGPEAAAGAADLVFTVPSDDPLVVQEVQETLYHVFWELVHVFLDGGGRS